MILYVTVNSFTLITIVAHQNLSTSVTLASFIQPRAVVCVSYAHTAVLSHCSVCITHDEKHFAAPKHRIHSQERLYCYLFIAYIFFTLLNM